MALLKLDCQSSVKSQGKFVTQIIHFVGGEKRTFENVESEYIKISQITQIYCNTSTDHRRIFLLEVSAENCFNLGPRSVSSCGTAHQ